MSVLGGFVGIAALAVAAPAISEIALAVAPRDYLLLALLGLLLVGSLSGESLARGLFCGALGIVLGLVGLDQMTAEPRFTFGTTDLLGGIPYVAAMIGFFGVSEALMQLRRPDLPPIRQRIDRIIPPWSAIRRHGGLTLRSSTIGVVVGALPGTGGDIAALLAYDSARRTVKNPTHPFGQGAEEGVVAPESANNAAVGGAYIPMLTLGIPGDAVTAVIIGALYIHGLKPGPMLMIETPHLFWFTVGNLTLANIFLLIFGLTGIRLFTRVAEAPRALLVPLILVLSVVGTYAIQNSATDVLWMLGFGVVGYFLRIWGFEVAPIVLGMILGPLIDASWRRAMISAYDDPLEFLQGFGESWISACLAAFLLAVLAKAAWRMLRPG